MHDKIFLKKTRTYLLRAVALATILTCYIGISAAQEAEHKWTANLGAGFTPLVGALDQRLDNGWNISFGGGYNFNDHFSLDAQVMYNGLGVSRGVLNELAVPDGNARVWAFTVEPRLNFAPRRHFTPYIVGGVGYYRRVVEFTQPTVAAVTVFDGYSSRWRRLDVLFAGAGRRMYVLEAQVKDELGSEEQNPQND